jgi:hypothetical protein
MEKWGLRMWDAGCEMWDVGCGISALRYWILDACLRITPQQAETPDYQIRNPKHEARNKSE